MCESVALHVSDYLLKLRPRLCATHWYAEVGRQSGLQATSLTDFPVCTILAS